MYTRSFYIDKIKPFIRKPVIKVITGMRRVGKSFFLRQIIKMLEDEGVKESNILYIDKELMDFDFIRDYHDLDTYIGKKFAGVPGEKYLFVDEVQEISEWERAINSILKKGDADIYVTGSNSRLLSSELATLISGRYVEFPIYALSFNEYLIFRGEKQKERDVEFRDYIRFGGLPGLHHFDLTEDLVYQYIRSVYDTILLKDIIRRQDIRNIHLLENINNYVFDNVGNIFSAKKVSDFLKSQKMNVGTMTVQNYISHLLATFAAYKVQRFDIKGKRILEIHEKYFVGDIGMRHAVLSYREADIAGLLENLVYLELMRRNYKVYIGKLDEKEIDFVAVKENRRLYIQVCYFLASTETMEREFSPLRQVKDNYPKYVLSMDTILGSDYEGIKRMNIIDFLLSPEVEIASEKI
jgi:predicted AAA+ superfamily ATPase